MSNKTSSRALARKDSSRWARRRNLRKQRGGSGIDITVLLVKRGFSCSKHSVEIRESAPDWAECRSRPHRPRRSATAQPPQWRAEVQRRPASGILDWRKGRRNSGTGTKLCYIANPIILSSQHCHSVSATFHFCRYFRSIPQTHARAFFDFRIISYSSCLT